MKKIVFMSIAMTIANNCFGYGVKGMRWGSRKGSLDGLPPEVLSALGAILILIVVGYSIYCAIANRRAAKAEEEARNIAYNQYQRWLSCVNKFNRLNLCATPRVPELISTSGEYVFGYSDSVLCELRAVRNGSYGGVSFRVCKGVSVHSGGTRGESHDELRVISRGKLIVTNNRIVFTGPGVKREVKMNKITSINSGWDFIEVGSETRQKSMFFTGINGNIYRDMINIIIANREEGFRGDDFAEVWKAV